MADSDVYGTVGAARASDGILTPDCGDTVGDIDTDTYAERGTATAGATERGTAGATARIETEASTRRLPLVAAVLLADVGVAVVTMVVLVVISLQRWDDTSLSAQHHAYAESLVVIFFVAALFGVTGVLLVRAKRTRVAVMQLAIAAAVVVFGIAVAANGNPKPDSSDGQAAASVSSPS